MNRTIKTFVLAFLSIVIIFSFISSVNAQNDDYTTLAPLPNTTNCGTGSGPECKTNLSTYLPGVFNFSIGIAAVLAFIMITIGGIIYATSDAISGKTEGRTYVTNALWGLLLVLGSYAIIYTINPQFLNLNLDVKTPYIPVGTPSASVGVPMTQQQIADDQAVRNQLSPVTVNNLACTTGATQGCTNVNGLPPLAITGVKNLQSACNCEVVITGGTEGGHATHGIGAPIMDLRPTAGLNSYLKATNPYDGQVVIKSFNGSHAKFVYEVVGGNASGTSTGNHWHVVFD